jgi:hypothetical protein
MIPTSLCIPSGGVTGTSSVTQPATSRASARRVMIHPNTFIFIPRSGGEDYIIYWISEFRGHFRDILTINSTKRDFLLRTITTVLPEKNRYLRRDNQFSGTIIPEEEEDATRPDTGREAYRRAEHAYCPVPLINGS